MPAFTNAIYYLENFKLVDSTTVNYLFYNCKLQLLPYKSPNCNIPDKT